MNFLTEITAPIVSFVELRWRSSPNGLSTDGIDMGNGQILPPEDVLDGHYLRLTDPMQAQSPLTSTEVSTEISTERHPEQRADRSLQPAIQKLAPELSPLTDLAADLATQTQQAQPAPQFRKNLHAALERAHQEQAAKRTLGIQPEPLHDSWWLARLSGWSILLVGTSTLVGIFVAFMLYRRSATRSVC